jgi:hypothetical protein
VTRANPETGWSEGTEVAIGTQPVDFGDVRFLRKRFWSQRLRPFTSAGQDGPVLELAKPADIGHEC